MGIIGTVAVRSIRPSCLEREVESAYESVWERRREREITEERTHCMGSIMKVENLYVRKEGREWTKRECKVFTNIKIVGEIRI